jgi:hypothetical protein
VEVSVVKRLALLLCFIGVVGTVFLGVYQREPHLDIPTVAAIAH